MNDKESDIYIILKDCLEHRQYERRIPDEEFLEKKTQEILDIIVQSRKDGFKKAERHAMAAYVQGRKDALEELRKKILTPFYMTKARADALKLIEAELTKLGEQDTN